MVHHSKLLHNLTIYLLLDFLKDEQIKGHMTTLAEILQNPEFAAFHVTGKEVNGKFHS